MSYLLYHSSGLFSSFSESFFAHYVKKQQNRTALAKSIRKDAAFSAALRPVHSLKAKAKTEDSHGINSAANVYSFAANKMPADAARAAKEESRQITDFFRTPAFCPKNIPKRKGRAVNNPAKIRARPERYANSANDSPTRKIARLAGKRTVCSGAWEKFDSLFFASISASPF